MEKLEDSHSADGDICGAATLERLWQLLKKLNMELSYDPAFPF